MITQRVVDKQIDKDAVHAAAVEYISRQEMRSHPAEEAARGGFTIAPYEIRACCKPFLRKKHALNVHCRSAEHVANLFDVGLQEMMNEVTRLKGE